MARNASRHDEKHSPSPARPTSDDAQESPSSDVLVVGIGASAGGLAAFEAFFTHLPTETDPPMAFVLVQHLAPQHKSILAELIQRFTPMPVHDAVDEMMVEGNHVYVIPPNTDLVIEKDRLHVTPPAETHRPHLPIDRLFRSLAQEKQEKAIAIVFSGAGSDGALGVREVKEAGGMVIVQTPENAEYASMPQSAIATGLVDYILPPDEMPAQLLKYTRHLTHRLIPTLLSPSSQNEDALQKIFILLRARTRHDFADYKQSTMLRRIARRLALHQLDSLDTYLQFLQNTPEEVTILFRELLIGVTRFFRDMEAFEALQTQVLPQLFHLKDGGDTAIRVWIPGCSTGEEAFSIAILMRDYLDAQQQSREVQIFATDIDPVSIQHARTATYPNNIAADVPTQYLERYFTRVDQQFRVKRMIRDMVTFAEQDVIQDPPFTRIDLLSCRNLLIYINADLQKKLLPLFHYALNPQGYLFLGTSETIGEFSELFATVSRKWKIYQRKAAVTSARNLPQIPSNQMTPTQRIANREVTVTKPRSLRALVETILLEHYSSPCVLINEKGEILFVHGSTSRYLETATGEANLNIHRMARPELRVELSVALHKALAQHELIRHDGMKVRNGDMHTFNLLIHPVSFPPEPILLLVVFVEVATIAAPSGDKPFPVSTSDKNQRITELERELLLKDEYLQSHIEELSTTNEELQSSNEELQSTNEELDTSREELQSVNEELTTVNAELEKKIDELSQANDDMNNLLAGTEIGTIFLDEKFCIQRFTPAATSIVNIRSTDIGRPLSHYSTNLAGKTRLADDAHEVYQTLKVKEVEVQTTAGQWFLMRILPYRTQRNEVAGVVFTFVNITEQHSLREEMQGMLLEKQAFTLAEAIVETVREPLLVLDAELRVVTVNDAFQTTFAVTRDETVGQFLYDVGNRQWDIPALRELLEAILPERTVVHDYLVSHDFVHLGQRDMCLNARELQRASTQTRMILLAIDDVTGKVRHDG